MKQVLLTRSHENNQELAAILSLKGYKVIEEPLINFYPLDAELNALSPHINIYTLIITSNYAAKLIAHHFSNKNLSCYVVGEASSNILKSAKFNILASFENVASLVKNIKITDNLLYLRGNHITNNFNLGQTEKIIYNTRYIQSFSPSVVKLLEAKQIDIITIYSLKAAKAFIKCIKHHNLEESVKERDIFCFSKNITLPFLEENYLNLYFSSGFSLEKFLKLF